MNETVRQMTLARGINRGRIAQLNHEPYPAHALTNRAIATDIVSAAMPTAHWLQVVWYRWLYAEQIEAWYRSGYCQGWELAREAATRRRFLAYRMVSPGMATYRRPGAS